MAATSVQTLFRDPVTNVSMLTGVGTPSDVAAEIGSTYANRTNGDYYVMESGGWGQFTTSMVSSITAGTGISVDTPTGDVTVSFDTSWGDARYATLSGAIFTGDVTSRTGVLARHATASHGFVTMIPGDASNVGYIEWYKPGPTRIAYLGYTSGTNLNLTLESGATFAVAGTLSATLFSGPLTGNVTGNASTATALQNVRTINTVSFDGTANIVVTAAASTLTGTTLNSTIVTSSLTSVGTLTSLTVHGSSMTNSVVIGPLSTNTNFGVVSFGIDDSNANRIGFAGGGTTDKNLYIDVPATGTFIFRHATVNAATISASLWTAIVPIAAGGATDPVRLDRLSDATTWGLVTFNGALSTTTALGIAGRAASQALNFYTPTGGSYVWQINGVGRMTLDSSAQLNLFSAGSVLKGYWNSAGVFGTESAIIGRDIVRSQGAASTSESGVGAEMDGTGTDAVFYGYNRSTALFVGTRVIGTTVSIGDGSTYAVFTGPNLVAGTGTFTVNQNGTTTLQVTNSNTASSASRAALTAINGTITAQMVAITANGVYLGAASNHDLHIMTNGSERILVTAAGATSMGPLAATTAKFGGAGTESVAAVAIAAVESNTAFGTSVLAFHSDTAGSVYHRVRIDTSHSLNFDLWNGSAGVNWLKMTADGSLATRTLTLAAGTVAFTGTKAQFGVSATTTYEFEYTGVSMSRGGSSFVGFVDRSNASEEWGWYANAHTARFYEGATGVDRITIAKTSGSVTLPSSQLFAIYKNASSPGIFLGDSGSAGQFGFFTWNSALGLIQMGTDAGGASLFLLEDGTGYVDAAFGVNGELDAALSGATGIAGVKFEVYGGMISKGSAAAVWLEDTNDVGTGNYWIVVVDTSLIFEHGAGGPAFAISTSGALSSSDQRLLNHWTVTGNLTVSGSVTFGSISIASLVLSGTITTASGVDWDLGDYSAGGIGLTTGTIAVTLDGNSYAIPAIL